MIINNIRKSISNNVNTCFRSIYCTPLQNFLHPPLSWEVELKFRVGIDTYHWDQYATRFPPITIPRHAHPYTSFSSCFTKTSQLVIECFFQWSSLFLKCNVLSIEYRCHEVSGTLSKFHEIGDKYLLWVGLYILHFNQKHNI
jgi:hypothetical protein